jgi:hypothetical protein
LNQINEAVVIISRPDCSDLFLKALEAEPLLNTKELKEDNRLVLFDAEKILEKLCCPSGASAEFIDKSEFDGYIYSIFGKIEKVCNVSPFFTHAFYHV